MKKLAVTFFLILLSLMARPVVFANDGSLRIDTSLNKAKEKTEILYFEQEGGLALLFQSETDKTVSKVQGAAEQSYERDKTGLFLQEIKSENVVETYQPLLFMPQTMVNRSDSYGVSLNEKSSSFSWQMLLMLLLGIFVTLYSLFRNRLKGQKMQ